MVRPEIKPHKISANNRTYMCTPAEVGHFLQCLVSELPLEELMDLGVQIIPDLHIQNYSQLVIFNIIFHMGQKNMFRAPHLCVKQTEVLHGLLPAASLYIGKITEGTHSMYYILLLNDRGEVLLKTALTECARAVCHGDHLKKEKRGRYYIQE